MANNKEERIAELYNALGNPDLEGAMARVYMSEYLYLTGNHTENGAWIFLTREQITSIGAHLVARERFEVFRFVAAVGLGLVAGAYVFSKSSLFKKPNPVQDRLDYLLDEDRVRAYTTEEFKVAMAEASALLANKAMGLLSEEELLKVQAEICDPSE